MKTQDERGGPVRRRIFEIIQPDDGRSAWSRTFDRLITALILASVVIVFAATFDLPPRVLRVLAALEGVASVVFTVEYLLRIATADFLYPGSGAFTARLRYMMSAMALVDLVAILPFWLPMLLPETMLGLRALRLVRLLRIFKLNRYSDAMKSLGDVIVAKKRELVGSFFFVALLMMVSSLLMYSAEHEVQPKVFRNAFSGLWWAVATLTTVGYGDIYPVTGLGRLVGAVIAFAGLAAVAIPTGIISSGLTERLERGKTAAADAGRETAEAARDRLLRDSHALLKDISKRLSKLGGKKVNS